MRFSLLLALALFAGVATADSFTSSAVSLTSKSVGSLSDSVSKSSESSSGGDEKKAAGLYSVTQLAQLDDGRVRLALAPTRDEQAALQLTLPAAVVAEQQIVAGSAIEVRERAYGLAFARAQQAEPFFLALAEPRRRSLDTVKL